MNNRQQTRELLELEIKLARLKIAASHLKQRKIEEAKAQQHRKTEAALYQLVDFGSNLASNGTVRKAALMPFAKKYKFGALLALAALQAWQKHQQK